jgi:hypothetical protein
MIKIISIQIITRRAPTFCAVWQIGKFVAFEGSMYSRDRFRWFDLLLSQIDFDCSGNGEIAIRADIQKPV